MLWAKQVVGFSGKYEMVILRRDTAKPESQLSSIATASRSTSQSVPVASPTNQSSTASLDTFLKAQTKIQDGKLLFEIGKLDEAETSLSQALILNPQSVAAQYYLKLVQEARRKEPEQRANSFSNPTGQTGTNQSTAGRRALLSKLKSIRFDKLSFENVPLREVVEELTSRSRVLDPKKRGINFIINHDAHPPLAADTGVPSQVPVLIDPTTGLPLPQPTPIEQSDIADASIRLLPALNDVTLEEALDAIVKVADRRIKYAIEDYAVVFSTRRYEPSPLYTRVIKVDPTIFTQGLEGVVLKFDSGAIAQPTTQRSPVTGVIRTNDTFQMQVRQFFINMGIDLTPPKSIFFNDREGSLVVRASLQDLDVIEQAVQVLNVSPPQIHIKAKFIAVPSEQLVALERQAGINPPDAPEQTEMLLTAPQTKVFLKALESNSDVDLVSEASVTTLSGRQTLIEVLPDSSELAMTNRQPFLDLGRIENSGSLQTNPPPVGVQLEISPSAHADYSTIQLLGKAVATEFLGFDAPETPRRMDTHLDLQGDTVVNGSRPGQLPLPRFRARTLTFNNTVYDGQTLVLSRIPADAAKSKDVAGQTKKTLLVLITPTLIDPAGNRINKQDQPQK
jgi:type II secretory pathway component GspD/PulD (secretin)